MKNNDIVRSETLRDVSFSFSRTKLWRVRGSWFRELKESDKKKKTRQIKSVQFFHGQFWQVSFSISLLLLLCHVYNLQFKLRLKEASFSNTILHSYKKESLKKLGTLPAIERRKVKFNEQFVRGVWMKTWLGKISSKSELRVLLILSAETLWLTSSFGQEEL